MLTAYARDQGSEVVSPADSPTATFTPTETPAATCDEPVRTKIDLVAKNINFNARGLVVPAREPLQVEFVNGDFVNHNLSIYTLEHSNVFTGDVTFPAERFTNRVPALEAGQYLFRCDIHPEDMSGPLVVQ